MRTGAGGTLFLDEVGNIPLLALGPRWAPPQAERTAGATRLAPAQAPHWLLFSNIIKH
jgi:hypothetical protein